MKTKLTSIFVCILVLLVSGCGPNVRRYKAYRDICISNLEVYSLTIGVRTIKARGDLAELSRKHSIRVDPEDYWKKIKEKQPDTDVLDYARRIRISFEQLGEPPTSEKETHEMLRKAVELLERAAILETTETADVQSMWNDVLSLRNQADLQTKHIKLIVENTDKTIP